MTRSKRISNARTFQNLKNAALASVEAVRAAGAARADEARARTTAVVTRLEKAFAQRVSRSVARLGVPSAKEVRALSRQVAELKASVAKLRRARA